MGALEAEVPVESASAAGHLGAERNGSPSTLARAARHLALCVVLMAPFTLPYVSHYLRAGRGSKATGFIHYDMAYYMANARAHFRGGTFTCTYSNPSWPDDSAPRIYVQPHLLVLGLACRFAGLEPGAIFVGFGALAALAFATALVALYRRFVSARSIAATIGLFLFAWGGGALAAAGLAEGVLLGGGARGLLRNDPAQGWWFLNLGRNFVLPTECLYHALFLGAILAMVNRRHWVGVALAALLSSCHPFSGLQLLLILVAWALAEVQFVKSRECPRPVLAALSALLVAHLAYYLGYLNSFPEHRVLAEAWRLPWELTARSFLPAYLFVGAAVAVAMRDLPAARAVLALPENRFLAVWFVVSFALANHEFAIRPIQPLHFTRGYVWAPLFLLGRSSWLALIERLGAIGRTGIRLSLTVSLCAVVCADNVVWLSCVSWGLDGYPPRAGLVLAREDWDVLRALDRPAFERCLLVCRDRQLGYLATVYTPLRSWAAHLHNTPHYRRRVAELERFYTDGQSPAEWAGRDLLMVLPLHGAPPLHDPRLAERRQETVVSGASWKVVRLRLPD